MPSNDSLIRREGIPAQTLTPVGYQQITDLDPAVGLTVPAGARIAVIQAEAQAVRWRDDGTDPTAAIGMPLAVGVAFTYTGDLAEILFFEQAAGAKLNIAYYS
jgi:hypothetical protein